MGAFLYIYLRQPTPPWMGLANHIGQMCNIVSTICSNSSRLALPADRRAMRLRNRSDLAGEIDGGGIDRQGTSPFCLVEALEQGHLVRRKARAFAPFGQEPLHLAPKSAHLAP
jgi:hypothetical protein